jgi:hypothetical protein
LKSLLMKVILPLSLASNAMATEADVTAALDKHHTAIAAKAFAQLSLDEKSSVQGQLLQSRLMFQQHKNEASYDLLKPLISDKTTDVALLYHFGKSAMVMAQEVSFFSKLSYVKAGLKAWYQGLALDKDHGNTLAGLVRFHLTAPKIGGGDLDEALKYALVLKGVEPERGYAQLANVYDKKEQPKQVSQLLNQGIAELPKNFRLYFDRGLNYAIEKKWSLAAKDWQQALINATTEDEQREALYQLGKLSDESGEQLKLGMEALQRLLAIEAPTSIDWIEKWGKYRLASLYVKNKQLTHAKTLIAQIDVSTDSDLKKIVNKLRRKI